MTSTDSPTATSFRSIAKTFASTHIVDRSAIVKHCVVPAWRSWPGLMSFSTTVPAIGARIVAWSGRCGLLSADRRDLRFLHA